MQIMEPQQTEESALLTGAQNESFDSTQSTSLPEQDQQNVSEGDAYVSQPEASNDSTREIDWRRLFKFIRPYVFPDETQLRLWMLLSFLCVLLGNLLQLIPPFAMKWIVDVLAPQNPTVSKVVPYFAILALFLGRLSNSAVAAFRSITYAIVSTKQTRVYSVACFRHILLLDMSYHVQRRTGETVNLMSRGASSVDVFINILLRTMIPTVIEACFVFGIFFKLGAPSIGIATLGFVILYTLFTKYVTEERIKMRRDLNEASEAVSDKEIDCLTNYESVKYFGNEEYESKQYEKLQSKYQEEDLKFTKSFQFLYFGQNLIEISGSAISLLLAARATANGTLSPGGFVMVSQFIGQIFEPLSYMGYMYSHLIRSATDIEKSIDLLDTKSKVEDAENAAKLQISEQDLFEKRKGRLTFENVSFRYETSNGRVVGVRNLTFEVQPGQTLGIVGSTGAGKSTLIRLIARFYDPDEGRILIDGENIRNFTQSSLRSLLGVVAQDTSLFNSSLRYNIAFGKVDATDQEIFEAAEAAQLMELIEELPDKLDTEVGERGIKIAGGERQRLGVARCILRKPIFVLFDEASSSLDSVTEREMQRALRDVIHSRTTIAVAHRLSTVMGADNIIVLDDGAIVEQGTHTELIRMNGKYKALWSAQTEIESLI